MRYLLSLALLILIGCADTEYASEQQQAECYRAAFTRDSELNEAYASMRAACGWIHKPERFRVCRTRYMHFSFNEDVLECEFVVSFNESHEQWITSMASEFATACRLDVDCLHWSQDYQSHHSGRLPSWWDNEQSTQEPDVQIEPARSKRPDSEYYAEAEFCPRAKFRDGLCMTSGKQPLDDENLRLWEEAREWWCQEYYGPDTPCPEPSIHHWIDYSRLYD